MTFNISFLGQVNNYNLTLLSNELDKFYVASEKCCFWITESRDKPVEIILNSSNFYEAEISLPQATMARYIQNYLDGWRIYHFHDTGIHSPIKKTADINDNHYFRADASNLPSYLLLLKERYTQSYSLICNTVTDGSLIFHR